MGDAGTRLLFKLRSGTQGLNEELGIALGLLKKSRGTYVNGAIIAMLYTHLIRIINNNSVVSSDARLYVNPIHFLARMHET